MGRVWASAQGLLLGLSLQSRIAVFMSGILLAVSLAFAYIGMEALNRSTLAVLDERRSTAILVARNLAEVVEHGEAHVRAVAETLSLPGALEDAVERRDVLVESQRQNADIFDRILIFDTSGRVVASAPAVDAFETDDDSRRIIAQALHSGQSTVSNVLQLPSQRGQGVLFVAPITNGARAYGLVAAEVGLPHPVFSSVADSLELGHTGHMEVIDGRGLVLGSTFPNVIGKHTEHPTFYLPLLYSGTVGVGDAQHYPRPGEPYVEEQHVMAFAPLRNAPWGVGLGQDETETFAVVSDLRNRAIAMAAAALIAALSLTWLGTLSVVRPIRLLTRAGVRMATGDLSEPIRIDQADEVGRLAQVVETMRQRLGQSLSEITAWNRQLEQRVHERTHALENSNRHLQALMAVATSASRASDRKEVLSEALQAVVKTLGARHAWAFLWDKEEQQLRIASQYHAADDEVVVPPKDVPFTCAEAIQRLDVNCRPQFACPVVNDGGEGHDRFVCWCSPLRMGGAPLGALCVALDSGKRLEADELALLDGIAQQIAVYFEKVNLIEERTRLEAGRHIERLRAEFLASVSHELRTPLGFIKGYTTTMLREDVTWNAAQRNEFLRIVDEESDRLTTLVDSLLDVAREQAGRLRMRLDTVALEPVVRRSIDRMSHSVGRHRIELRLGDRPTIVADGARLEQVIVNLLQNAIKYSPEDSTVEVVVANGHEGVGVSVLDRGFGMPAAEVPHIFEPFYRVSNGHTAAAGGAGLGLTICRAIVEAHGGRIWAEARAGGGTAVHFRLPYQPPEEGDRTDEQEVRVSS